MENKEAAGGWGVLGRGAGKRRLGNIAFGRMGLVLAALAAAFFPLPLSGQDFFQIRDEIARTAWLNKGGFYLRPSLTIGNIGYNSNIYSFDYLETPDWVGQASLNLDAALVIRDRFIIQASESPSYAYYRDTENERAFNNEFQLAAHTHMGRFNLHYRFEKLYVRSVVNPETEWRLRRWETSHVFSADYGNQQRFYLSAYFRRSDFTFEDELLFNTYNVRVLFARSEYWAGVSLNKALFTRTRFSFHFDYYDHRYQFARMRNRTGGQLSFRLVIPGGRNLTGSVQYGLRFVRPLLAIHRDFTRPFGNGMVMLRVLSRFQVTVDYLLDSRYSFSGVDLYYDEQSAGAGLRVILSRGLHLSGALRAGKRSYYSLNGDYLRRRDDFTQGSAALTWRPGEKTELGLQYTIYDSDSVQPRFLRGYQSMGGYIRYDF